MAINDITIKSKQALIKKCLREHSRKDLLYFFKRECWIVRQGRVFDHKIFWPLMSNSSCLIVYWKVDLANWHIWKARCSKEKENMVIGNGWKELRLYVQIGWRELCLKVYSRSITIAEVQVTIQQKLGRSRVEGNMFCNSILHKMKAFLTLPPHTLPNLLTLRWTPLSLTLPPHTLPNLLLLPLVSFLVLVLSPALCRSKSPSQNFFVAVPGCPC